MKDSIVIIISDISGGMFLALRAGPPVCLCHECFIVSCVIREPLLMWYQPGCDVALSLCCHSLDNKQA